MVEIKFIIEIVLLVLTLVVVVWWLLTNWSNITTAFTSWIKSAIGG